MKNHSHKTTWILDAAIFGGFWLASMLDLTGLALHQWLGLAVGLAAGYHLFAHWSWVKSVTQRWFGRTSNRSRLYYLVDLGLLLGFSLILASGLVMSTWFDFSLANYAAWRSLHVTVTIATLVLTILKIAIHGRWIVSVARRSIWPASRQPQTVPRKVEQIDYGRRDFLKMMALVTGAAVIASISALNGAETPAAGGAAAAQSETTLEQPSTAGSSASSLTQSSSASQCLVRCNRRCSYPGHCRRYTDSNGNGRCDLGECA